ncbi:MAG: T9SS type A sorting domain-containing protein [candidate division WOR-3 bacterium]
MLLLLSLSINSVASIDMDGDGDSEIFVGTDSGLLIYDNLLVGNPIGTPIKSKVEHISYNPEGFSLVITTDDPSNPIILLKLPSLKDSSLPITGRYKKTFYFNGSYYLLSDAGLFKYHNDSITLFMEGVKDITICGLGGRRSMFVLLDNRITVIGDKGGVLKGGGDYIFCGDTTVITSKGYITFNGKGYEFFEGGESIGKAFSLSTQSNNFISLAVYMDRVYVIFGRNKINSQVLNKPFFSYSHPFILHFNNTSLFAADLNLYNSVSFGILPVNTGSYRVEFNDQEVEVIVSDYGNYRIRDIFSGDEVLTVSYGRGNVEIMLNISEPSRVEVYIISLTGKVLKTLYKGFKNKSFKVYWDGYTDQGMEVKSGVYFVKVLINGRTFVKRVVWLK